MSKHYPRDLRLRAVQLVLETRHQYPSRDAAIRSVAANLEIGTAQSLRNWVRQAEIDAGVRPGVTTGQSEVIRALKRENAQLKRENGELRQATEILREAAFFAAEIGPAIRVKARQRSVPPKVTAHAP